MWTHLPLVQCNACNLLTLEQDILLVLHHGKLGTTCDFCEYAQSVQRQTVMHDAGT